MTKPTKIFLIMLALVSNSSLANDCDTSLLTTWDASNDTAFPMAAQEGTLNITDACVTIDYEDSSVLPAWPEPTSWNPDTKEITFVSPIDGSETVLKHGDDVILGGAGAQPGFNELYVVTPNTTCNDETVFVVNSAEVRD